MSIYPELEQDLESHEVAFTETSFLLEILVATLEDLMGTATATVGVSAGRAMGTKVPIYLEKKELKPALEAIAERLGAGFEIEVVCDDGAEEAEVRFGRCAMREVCKRRNIEVGGHLCKTFHHYLAGMATHLLQAPMRARITSTGDTCVSVIEYR